MRLKNVVDAFPLQLLKRNGRGKTSMLKSKGLFIATAMSSFSITKIRILAFGEKVENRIKTVEIGKAPKDKLVEISLWDTINQDFLKSVEQLFCPFKEA